MADSEGLIVHAGRALRLEDSPLHQPLAIGHLPETKERPVVYWVKVVFIDNQELLIRDAIRHTISDDMEVLEVDSAKKSSSFR